MIPLGLNTIVLKLKPAFAIANFHLRFILAVILHFHNFIFRTSQFKLNIIYKPLILKT